MFRRCCFTILSLLGPALLLGCASPGLDSIQITPANPVMLTGGWVQFIAIGTSYQGDKPGTTQDLTDSVTWASSSTDVATIGSTGFAVGVAPGLTTISATKTGFPGTVLASVQMNVEAAVCTSTGPGPCVPTVTVYKLGEGTGTVLGSVSAPSSGPVVINCGSGATCIGNFPLNSTVTLTATPDKDSNFGGWSSNCAPFPNNGPSPTSSCTLLVTENEAVGAIFNPVAK